MAHHCPDVEAAYLEPVARAFTQAAPDAVLLLTASASTKKRISPDGSFLLAGPAGIVKLFGCIPDYRMALVPDMLQLMCLQAFST